MKPRFQLHQWLLLALLSIILVGGAVYFGKVDIDLFQKINRHRKILTSNSSDSLTVDYMESYLDSINNKLMMLDHSSNVEQKNTIILSDFNEKLSSFPGIIAQEVIPQPPQKNNGAELFTLSVKCQGSYKEIARLLDVLEKSSPIFFIKSVTLKSNTKNKTLIQSELVLQQFFKG